MRKSCKMFTKTYRRPRQLNYREPLVVDVLLNNTYQVSQPEEKQKGHFHTTTAHVSQLQPWRIYEDNDS